MVLTSGVLLPEWDSFLDNFADVIILYALCFNAVNVEWSTLSKLGHASLMPHDVGNCDFILPVFGISVAELRPVFYDRIVVLEKALVVKNTH